MIVYVAEIRARYTYIFKPQIDLLIYSVSRFECGKSQALRHKDEEERAVFLLHVLPLSGSSGALALTSPRELCKKDSQTWFPGWIKSPVEPKALDQVSSHTLSLDQLPSTETDLPVS